MNSNTNLLVSFKVYIYALSEETAHERHDFRSE